MIVDSLHIIFYPIYGRFCSFKTMRLNESQRKLQVKIDSWGKRNNSGVNCAAFVVSDAASMELVRFTEKEEHKVAEFLDNVSALALDLKKHLTGAGSTNKTKYSKEQALMIGIEKVINRYRLSHRTTNDDIFKIFEYIKMVYRAGNEKDLREAIVALYAL